MISVSCNTAFAVALVLVMPALASGTPASCLANGQGETCSKNGTSLLQAKTVLGTIVTAEDRADDENSPTAVFQCTLDVQLLFTSHRNQQLEDRTGTLGFSNHKGGYQKWVITNAGDGKVFITSHRNQQLEDRSGILGLSHHKGGYQKWVITDAGDGKVFITSDRNKQLEDRSGTLGLHNSKGGYQKWDVRKLDNAAGCNLVEPVHPQRPLSYSGAECCADVSHCDVSSYQGYKTIAACNALCDDNANCEGIEFGNSRSDSYNKCMTDGTTCACYLLTGSCAYQKSNPKYNVYGAPTPAVTPATTAAYQCATGTIEVHSTMENHGDVCRVPNMPFSCPIGCVKVAPNAAPYCVWEGTQTACHQSTQPAGPPPACTVTANAAIQGYNNKRIYSQTPAECSQACIAETEFVCKSFDYSKTFDSCDLSDKSAADVGGLKTDYSGNPYDYYACPTPTSPTPTSAAIATPTQVPHMIITKEHSGILGNYFGTQYTETETPSIVDCAQLCLAAPSSCAGFAYGTPNGEYTDHGRSDGGRANDCIFVRSLENHHPNSRWNVYSVEMQ